MYVSVSVRNQTLYIDRFSAVSSSVRQAEREAAREAGREPGSERIVEALVITERLFWFSRSLHRNCVAVKSSFFRN